MNAHEHLESVRSLKGSVKFQRFVIGTLLLFLGVSIVQIMRIQGQERTIITPPVINKTFWVDTDKVSPEYLEQMADFMAHYILNVTPENVAYNQGIVLQYVLPTLQPDMKQSMMVEASRLKRDGATTMFFPRTIQVYELRQAVHISGALDTYVQDRKVSRVNKNYLAEFQYKGGRIYLKSFKEVTDDPFQQKATSTPAPAQ